MAQKSPFTDSTPVCQSALKSKLDSIYAEVEKNLPSIDFELSDVSSDEEVGIFHRTLKTPTLDDDDKDLDESFSEHAWKDLLQPTDDFEPDNDAALHKIRRGISDSDPLLQNVAKQNQVTDTVTRSVGTSAHYDSSYDSGVTVSDKMNASLNSNSSPPKVLKNTWVNEENKKSVPVIHTSQQNNADSDLQGLCEKSVNKNEEVQTAKERKNRRGQNRPVDVRQTMYTPYIPALPSFSLLSIDNVNLDKALQEIRELGNKAVTEDGTANRALDENCTVDAGTGDGLSLIEKLAKLTITQSGNTELKNVDPVTGALKHNRAPPVSKSVKTAKNAAVEAEEKQQKKYSSVGVSTSITSDASVSAANEAKEPANEEKHETIYLDLRDFDKNQEEQKQRMEAVQRILQLNTTVSDSSSSDDSDEEEEVGLWHEQRRRIKEGLSVKDVRVTQNSRSTSAKASTESTTKSPRSPRTQAQRLARPQPTSQVASTAKKDEVHKPATEVSTVPTPEPVIDAVELEKQKKLELARKAREHKEHQRMARVRLSQRLEALRPTHSHTEKQPCAEATPTLFDVEASYEPAPCSLPDPVSESTECVLLTVHLSSNGQIIFHRSGHRSVDSGSTLSASFATLLTWLLSLVPEDFTPGPSSTESLSVIPPFKVVGLQQLYIDEQLALYIVVVPTENSVFFSPSKGKTKKSKLKDEVKGSSAFRQSVIKFLSKHTLHTVCPWLTDMVSTEVTGINRSTLDGTEPEQSVYRPALPSVTTRPLSTFIQVNPDINAAQKIFGMPVGFFWQTVENEETEFEQNLNNKDICYETQNTMSLVYKGIYREPCAMMAIFNRVLQEGLDLSGIRLLYPTTDLMSIMAGKPAQNDQSKAVAQSSNENSDDLRQQQMCLINRIGPILAVTLRGTFARTVWLDNVGPADPILARRTDPNSLSALFGGNSRDECLLFTPRNPVRVLCEITRWFGGRVPANGVIDVGTSHPPKSHLGAGKKFKSHHNGKDFEIPGHRPPATLTATIHADVFVVLSPLVPVRCLGLLLATCQRRGYQLHGIKRLYLSTRRANCLGITGALVSVYSPMSSTPSSPSSVNDGHFDNWSGGLSVAPLGPCTILLLNKENASHHSASLIENFMVQLSLQGLLGSIQKCVSQPLSTDLLFHSSSYSDGLLKMLGGDFSKVPEHEFQSSPSYIAPRLHSNPELEQAALLTLTGHDHMRTFGLYLGKLLNVLPYSKTQPLFLGHEGFELLGIKWLPGLTNSQARELTPFEVGDPLWKKSIHSLTSEPAVVLVLRSIDALHRLSAIINQSNSAQVTKKPAALDKIMAATPELVYRQASLFFKDHELFADPQSRPLMKFLPPPPGKMVIHPQSHMEENTSLRGRKAKSYKRSDDFHFEGEESIFKSMTAPPRPITTVLIIKPEAVKKHAGKIFRRIHQEGFSLVGLRMALLTTEQAESVSSLHDSSETDQQRSSRLTRMTSAPAIMLCLQRENAVKKLIDLIGPEDPQIARRQNHFLWRGMFGTDLASNGVYCSANFADAIQDQRLFFRSGLCCRPNDDLMTEQIPCPAVDEVLNIKRLLNTEITYSQPAETSGGHVSNSRVTHLTQTNCILLMSALLSAPGGHIKKAGYVDIIEHLLTQRFEIVGARLVWLTESQAEHYLRLSEAGSFALVPSLTCGPCLVLALQRDNAVMAFESLMGGSFQRDSIYATYGDKILRAKDTAQAGKLLTYVFDDLMPGSQAQFKKTGNQEA